MSGTTATAAAAGITIGALNLSSITSGVDSVLSSLGVSGPILNFWNLSKAQLPAIVTDAEAIYKEVTGLIANVMGMVHQAQVPTQADWDKAIGTTKTLADRLAAQVKPVPTGA